MPEKTHRVRVHGTSSNDIGVDFTVELWYTQENAESVAKDLNTLFNSWGEEYENIEAVVVEGGDNEAAAVVDTDSESVIH